MAAHYLSRSQRDCMNYINSTTSTWPSETKYLYSSQLEQIVDNTIGSTRNKLIFAGDTITKANPVQKVKVLKPTFNEKLSKEDAQLVVDSVLNLHKEIVGNFNLDYRAAFEFFTERMPELKNDNVNTVLANCFNHNSEYINSSLTDREKTQQMELLKKNSASNETYLKIISTLLTQDINSIKSLIGKLSKIGTPKAKALIDQDVQLLVDFSQLKQLLDATHHSLRTMNPDDVSTQ
jgi:hypothetical protein